MNLVKVFFRRLLVENAGLKLVAIAFATVLFFIAREETIREVEIEVPLATTAPEADRVLMSQPPSSVRVRIRGNAARLTDILARRTPYELNLSEFGNNQTVLLVPESLETHLGEGIKVLSVSPSSFTIQFDRMETRSVPVSIDILQGPGAYWKVAVDRQSVDPRQVEITGPSSLLDQIRTVHTEALDLSNITKDFAGKVALEKKDGVKVNPSSVQVIIPIEEETGSRLIAGARMVVKRCPVGLSCYVTPAFFQARIEGKERMVDQVTRANLSHYVYIDAARLPIPPEIVQKDILAVEPTIEGLKGAEIILPGPKYFNVTVKKR